jgi:hypothetical protein
LRFTASSATSRTAGMSFGRIAAHHGYDALFLAGLQQFLRSGSLLVVQRPLQTALLVTVADFPNGLRRHRNNLGDAWRTDAFAQLQ